MGYLKNPGVWGQVIGTNQDRTDTDKERTPPHTHTPLERACLHPLGSCSYNIYSPGAGARVGSGDWKRDRGQACPGPPVRGDSREITGRTLRGHSLEKVIAGVPLTPLKMLPIP